MLRFHANKRRAGKAEINLVGRKRLPRDEQTVVSDVYLSIPDATSGAGYNAHSQSLRDAIGPFQYQNSAFGPIRLRSFLGTGRIIPIPTAPVNGADLSHFPRDGYCPCSAKMPGTLGVWFLTRRTTDKNRALKKLWFFPKNLARRSLLILGKHGHEAL